VNAEQPPAGEEFVQSLARGLAVIQSFDAEHAHMTLSEVSARTDLSRATVRRFLHTLVELGFVRNDGRQFALTPQVLRLGTAYLSGLELPQIAQPHLEALSAKVGESTSAAVLDGPDIVYVARVATRRIMSVGITVGTRFPAYATSMGRVLLATLDAPQLDDYFAHAEMAPLTTRTLHDEDSIRNELAAVRVQGWALVDQELEIGLRSMGAPIYGAGGKPVAAINVSTSVGADDADGLKENALVALLDAARAITDDLAMRP
jgi:IclR family transcriptional regulator, pca regulon regulatory protein